MNLEELLKKAPLELGLKEFEVVDCTTPIDWISYKLKLLIISKTTGYNAPVTIDIRRLLGGGEIQSP